jgi:uncharacterized protein YjdB
MKKILIPLLALTLLCVSLGAAAEGQEAITLELNTAKLPLYAADDPYLDGLADPAGTLPVLVLPVKKSWQLQVTVLPKTLKNRKFTLAVDNGDLAKVQGNTVTGLRAGETVLTIASAEDPAAAVQYRLAVIQQVTRMTLSAPEKNVAVGGTLQLTPAYLPEDASKKQVTWVSENEKLATVDENGLVTGLKRGTVRITATAADGSRIRASISLNVVQKAEEITLDKPEVTVDTGRTAVIRATVLPKDTNDKNVVWSSSDESVAKVNNQGRITGVALGECEITCASKTTGDVQAKAVVHVQQPVTKITMDEAPVIYAGESAQLTWHVEPANASNQTLSFKSANPKVLTVSEDGTVTGVAFGEAFVNVSSTDGSNRQARVKVKVMQHVTGVHMYRHTAYIDIGATNQTRAIVEPDKGTNHNMTWESADESIATAEQEAKQPNRAKIRGIREGETTVTVTTEDGGYQASLLVKVGDFENSLKWVNAEIDGRGNPLLRVKNVSDLYITYVKVELTCYDWDGTPAVGINTKDDSNVLTAIYTRPLAYGETSRELDGWKIQNRDKEIVYASMDARIVEFEIDHDWVKLIRTNHRPLRRYRP